MKLKNKQERDLFLKKKKSLTTASEPILPFELGFWNSQE
jgi:hypothetical protein